MISLIPILFTLLIIDNSSGGSTARILRYVDVPYVSLEECRNTMRGVKIYDEMICAGNIKYGGKDACQVVEDLYRHDGDNHMSLTQ